MPKSMPSVSQQQQTSAISATFMHPRDMALAAASQSGTSAGRGFAVTHPPITAHTPGVRASSNLPAMASMPLSQQVPPPPGDTDDRALDAVLAMVDNMDLFSPSGSTGNVLLPAPTPSSSSQGPVVLYDPVATRVPVPNASTGPHAQPTPTLAHPSQMSPVLAQADNANSMLHGAGGGDKSTKATAHNNPSAHGADAEVPLPLQPMAVDQPAPLLNPASKPKPSGIRRSRAPSAGGAENTDPAADAAPTADHDGQRPKRSRKPVNMSDYTTG